MDLIEVKTAKLLRKKNAAEFSKVEVFAECYPVGRDEFNIAGQNGYKPSFRADVWGSEYDNQTLIEIGGTEEEDGKRYDIYRTYGPKPNGKIELYASERTGKK